MEMEQIYVDTLNTVVIHKYDLDALVLELEMVERHNAILYIVLAALILIGGVVGYIMVRRHRRVMVQEYFTKRLLSRQAGNLPYMSDSISKISNKSILVSASLSEELQSLLNNVKSESKNSFAEIVNDAAFIARYPYIREMDFLSPAEKLVLIFTEEGYPVKEIALLVGSTDTSVRAMKTRIRSKLTQSGCNSALYNALAVFTHHHKIVVVVKTYKHTATRDYLAKLSVRRILLHFRNSCANGENAINVGIVQGIAQNTIYFVFCLNVIIMLSGITVLVNHFVVITLVRV